MVSALLSLDSRKLASVGLLVVYISLSREVYCNVSSSNGDDVQDQVTTFWEVEEVPRKGFLLTEETRCENHFVTRTTRDNTGRFVVKIPLKDSLLKLSDSYQTSRPKGVQV